MAIRRDPIYLSSEVYRALWLVSKINRSQGKDEIITPDEVADLMLRKSIAENYPAVFEHQKNVEKLEKELLKSL